MRPIVYLEEENISRCTEFALFHASKEWNPSSKERDEKSQSLAAKTKSLKSVKGIWKILVSVG